MRLLAGINLVLILKSHAAAAAATLSQPLVLLLDPTASSRSITSSSEAIDPSVARLIFAHRLGLSRFHNLGDINDKTLEQINAYGGVSQRVFPSRPEQQQGIFVVVEDVGEVTDNFDSTYDSFELTASPSESQNRALCESFWRQTQLQNQRTPKATEVDRHIQIKQDIKDACPGLWNVEPTAAFGAISCKGSSDKLSTLLQALLHASDGSHTPLTVVLVPRTSKGSTKATDDPYGLKNVAKLALRKRDEAVFLEDSPSTSEFQTSDLSPAQPEATSTKYPLSAKHYKSVSECMSETQNCTGHGECTQKGEEWFVCTCKPQVGQNANGKQVTTYYGGSACQKVDISAPFWILTITAGSLVALVGFGLSMLYTMGNQELPSVIGAGVSGPRAK